MATPNLFTLFSATFLSTFIGGLILLLRRKDFSPKIHALLIGSCAGIMLGASFISLIGPAVDLLKQAGLGENRMLLVQAVFVFLAGAFIMEAVHMMTPHEHQLRGEDGLPVKGMHQTSFRRAVLIFLAMALHNMPEGMALGIGSLQTDEKLVRGLTIGIFAQNIPEGMMMALALAAAGSSVGRAILGVALAGMVEAISALIGVTSGASATNTLPWALLLCGGAMVYVVSQEMIPESHANGHERIATFSMLAGLAAFGALSI